VVDLDHRRHNTKKMGFFPEPGRVFADRAVSVTEENVLEPLALGWAGSLVEVEGVRPG
jgi:hypothetical protein